MQILNINDLFCNGCFRLLIALIQIFPQIAHAVHGLKNMMQFGKPPPCCITKVEPSPVLFMFELNHRK